MHSVSLGAPEAHRQANREYNWGVTLTEYVHQIPDRGASAVLGIWCTFPNSVTTEVDASLFEDNGYHLFQWLEGRKGYG